MAVDVEELVIEPFLEIVKRGKEAIVNAEASKDEDVVHSQQVLRSARALVREGERALKRLQPLWDSQVEKHGDAFREAMKDNNELFDKRRALQELLYDFEDYIETDTFDANRFSAVQAASKSFALDVIESIGRMQIDQSTTAFPPLPPLPSVPRQLPPRPTVRMQRRPATSDSKSIPSAQHSMAAMNSRSPTTSEPVGYHEFASSSGKHHSRRPSSPDILGIDSKSVRITAKSPFPTKENLDSADSIVPGIQRSKSWVDAQADSRHRSVKGIPVTIGVDAAAENRLQRGLARMTLDSSARASSIFDASTPGSPTATTNRTSVFSSTSSTGCSPTMSSAVLQATQLKIHHPRLISSEGTGSQLEVLRPPLETDHENGLMLADERTLSDAGTAHAPAVCGRAAERSIGPKSSLYLLKGFCVGAHAFRSGGLSVSTKATFEYGTTTRVGICKHCEFRHPWDQIELDMKGDARGNFTKAGVHFRLRFLYKSHLATQSITEFQYGCVFCAQMGCTSHEGDATVFTTRDQLFQHLSRHSQPLPDVPSIVVIYGNGVSANDDGRDDYDLHFPEPPAPPLIRDPLIVAKLMDLPTATALKNHVQRYGDRDLADPDGDKTNVLKFLAGARLVGVEFPERWAGRWCIGWHDGVRGAFPADRVMLEPPANGEVRLPGISGATVTTRWKWSSKNTDGVGGAVGWLSFGKGEVITNVCWLYREHWCWSGMNKKGKLGIFPASHIQPMSVRESDTVTDGAVVKKQPKYLRLFNTQTQTSASLRDRDSF